MDIKINFIKENNTIEVQVEMTPRVFAKQEKLQYSESHIRKKIMAENPDLKLGELIFSEKDKVTNYNSSFYSAKWVYKVKEEAPKVVQPVVSKKKKQTKRKEA